MGGLSEIICAARVMAIRENKCVLILSVMRFIEVAQY